MEPDKLMPFSASFPIPKDAPGDHLKTGQTDRCPGRESGKRPQPAVRVIFGQGIFKKPVPDIGLQVILFYVRLNGTGIQGKVSSSDNPAADKCLYQ